jgi:hypothetical protein
MSRRYHRKAPIYVHDHDVLSGRGVNIAQHPGNERFRSLVTTRADENYCTQYTASEKRAVAEDIIKHIKSLDPPGRFLRKDERGGSSKGLNGPWEELPEHEAIKKTCQALRDCNRSDRQGYAADVAIPDDVLQVANQRAQSGLSVKQQAEVAVAAAQSSEEVQAAASLSETLKRARAEPVDWGRVSPSVENAAEWLKKQRTDDAMATAAAAAAISEAAAAEAVSSLTNGASFHEETTAQQSTDDALTNAATTYSSGAAYHDDAGHHQDSDAAAAAAAISEFNTGAYHDETASTAASAMVYSPNDLLGHDSEEDDDDEDLDVAEAAEVVASITENDDTNVITPGTQYPSLSASEEALAREMAAAGGLMSHERHFEGTDGLYQHSMTGGSGADGGLDLHNMNEL